MAKKISGYIKLQVPAGKATPAPPVGPALGPHGVQAVQFCQQFNEATKDMVGTIIPAEISIYEDRTFDFKLKTPPASDLLRKAAGVTKGSANPLKIKVGTVSEAQVREIATRKMEDLNTEDVEQAAKIIKGAARSMGIEVK